MRTKSGSQPRGTSTILADDHGYNVSRSVRTVSDIAIVFVDRRAHADKKARDGEIEFFPHVSEVLILQIVKDVGFKDGKPIVIRTLECRNLIEPDGRKALREQ